MSILNEVLAAGKVTAAGAVTVARGCVPAKTAAGIYTLTLDQPVDAAESIVLVQPNTAALNVLVADTTDTVKTLTFETDAGVDTDSDFTFLVMRISGGAGR